MKTLSLSAIVLLLLAGFTSCSSDDDSIPLLSVTTKTVTNLYAPQQGGQGQPTSGDFTKFDFEKGEITTSTTDWDIAFRGTTIIVNGGASTGTTDEPERTAKAGAYIASGTMAGVAKADVTLFKEDSSEGLAIPKDPSANQGWYTYDQKDHTIVPTAGKIVVIKNRNGKYAKIEILSYYKDAPKEITPEIAQKDSRYYTFDYVFQPNVGVTEF